MNVNKAGFRKAIYIIISVLSVTFFINGCSRIEDFQVKYGWRNRDFEYIKQNKVNKVIIQSTRDSGFRFTVTDKRTIRDLYDILSKANPVEEKSNLQPDYIFEMYEDSQVYKFSYVAGLDKQNLGNFYSDEAIYIVSKRIDNDIVRNLWNIRKPREFHNVYYKSILMVLNKISSEIDSEYKVGINISEDIDVAKYLLSMDIDNFTENYRAIMRNAELVSQNKETFDVLVTVKTYGYRSDVYKSIITVQNKKEKSEVKYYVNNRHENGEWDYNVTLERPMNF
jgi:hypothetical protein